MKTNHAMAKRLRERDKREKREEKARRKAARRANKPDEPGTSTDGATEVPLQDPDPAGSGEDVGGSSDSVPRSSAE